MATQSFSASRLVSQYYNRSSRYVTDAAFQGARWRDSYSVELVGVIVVPSLSTVAWKGKLINAATLTVTVRPMTKYSTMRLYRSLFNQYYDNPQKYGSEYLDTEHGYTEIDIGTTTSGQTATVTLSAANIAFLQSALRAGCTAFTIYYAGDTATASVPQSEHFFGTSAFTLSITYEDAKSLISNATNANIGSRTTLSWTNYAEGVVSKVRFTLGSADSGVLDATGSSYSYLLPASWYNQLPTSTSGTATAYLYSYIDGTLIGTDTTTFTASVPASIVPTIGTITATKQNDNETVDGWDIWLQTYTKAIIAVSGCAAGAGARISSYSIRGQDMEYSAQTSDAGVTATSGTLSASGDLTFTVTVTDSRGRAATGTVMVSVLAYAPPNIVRVIGVRCRQDGTVDATTGTYIRALMEYTFTAVGTNSVTNELSYKAHPDTFYTTVFTDVQSNVWTSPFGAVQIDLSYDVKGYVVDTLGNSATYVYNVPSVAGISFGLKNDRARFGGVCERAGLQVDWELILTNALKLFTDKVYPVRMTDGNGNLIFEMINANGVAQFSVYNAGTERNYIGDGRLSCYDSTGTETARLSSDKSLKLGSTTLTEAALAKFLTSTSTTPTSSHTITQATVNTFGLSGATITEVNAVVRLTSAASNGTVLLSGLPKAKYGTYYLAFCGGDANGTTYALKYGNQSDYADIQSAQSIASGTTVRMHLVYLSE